MKKCAQREVAGAFQLPLGRTLWFDSIMIPFDSTPMKIGLLRVLVFLSIAMCVCSQTVGNANAQTTAFSQSADGRVVAWGANGAGQSTVPSGLSNVVAISAGSAHSVALKSNGTVIAWGSTHCDVDEASGWSGVAMISAGRCHNVALLQDSTVIARGDEEDPSMWRVPAGLTNVIAVAAGREHTIALLEEGTVVTWGTSTNVPMGLSNIVAVAAGNRLCIALREDHSVVAWTWYRDPTSFRWIADEIPLAVSNATAVAAMEQEIVILQNDGTVSVYGPNGQVRTNVPIELTNVVAISAGTHAVALKGNGTVLAWYPDGAIFPTPGNLSGLIAISAGDGHNLALRAILSQPISQTVVVGQLAEFQVRTAEVGAKYQWQKNGIEIRGATNSTFVIPTAQTTDGGTYIVRVTVSQGSLFSMDATLTVTESPEIGLQPLGQTIERGMDVKLAASAYGAPPLVFQWYFDGFPIGTASSGTNVAVWTIPNAQTNHSGRYKVRVFNPHGNASSVEAVVNVVVYLPQITRQPTALTRVTGQSATFAVEVAGTPPFGYQWRLNGGLIENATNAVLAIPVVGLADAGRYSVLVINSAGGVTSAETILWVIEPPSLGLQLLAGYPLLSLRGALGSNFLVEYSTATSVTNWVPLRAISNLTVTPYQFLDGDGSTSPARFYRAIMR